MIRETVSTASDIIGVGKSVIGSNTDRVLIRNRDQIFEYFKGKGVDPSKKGSPLNMAIEANKMSHKDIPNRKNESYDPEWSRLYQMVIDTFNNMGRSDLADNFRRTVPVFDSQNHSPAYVKTLLDGGAKNPANEQRFAALLPFKSTMQTALNSVGIAAPPDMENLTQLFYNNFVAKAAGYEKISFEELTPAQTYNLDDAVINATIAYLATLKDRKESGEQLSKIEDKLATATQRVEAGITARAKEEVQQEIGGTILSNKNLILIVAVVLIGTVAVLVFRK